jgi:hypothetical protein
MNKHPMNVVKESRSHPTRKAMKESSNRPTSNPFCSGSRFNRPLRLETCQQIHAEALERVARGDISTVPSSIPASVLSISRRRYGPEVCLVHPAEVERVFRGVTLSVYQEIESLYCSRPERSIWMITQILSAQAAQCGVPPLQEEAVWAVCLYLDERRAEQTEVSIEQEAVTWWIGTLGDRDAAPSRDDASRDGALPTLVAIFDTFHSSILAFRAGSSKSCAELSALALYDALCAARRPTPRTAAGLTWRVPTRLLTQVRLPDGCEEACASLGIQVEQTAPALAQAVTLGEQWRLLTTQRRIAPARWTTAFDSYLNARFGTSPLRAHEQADHTFRHLIGYTADPAALIPALRALLPQRQAVISDEGAIAYDGLHYAHDLLTLFPGSSVQIRRSQHTEAVIWVYLEGDLLGEALARELARRDGSYRAHR